MKFRQELDPPLQPKTKKKKTLIIYPGSRQKEVLQKNFMYETELGVPAKNWRSRQQLDQQRTISTPE